MFEPGLLRGKRVLITGGGSGLGRSMGRRFAELGASLTLCGRRPDALAQTADELRDAFGATVAAVFAAFPRELVMTIAGLALLGTIGNGLAVALRDETSREPALVTFLVTASGLTLFGIGSAFWGLIAGAAALMLARWPFRDKETV